MSSPVSVLGGVGAFALGEKFSSCLLTSSSISLSALKSALM